MAHWLAADCVINPALRSKNLKIAQICEKITRERNMKSESASLTQTCNFKAIALNVMMLLPPL